MANENQEEIKQVEKQNSVPTENKQKKRGAPEKYLFKPGQSGNPKGRAKGTYSLLTILKRKLAKVIKKKGIEAGEELVDIWLNKAKTEKGFEALKEIVHYTDGMPKTTMGFDLDETIGGIKIEIIKPKEEIKEENKKEENAEISKEKPDS